MSVLWMILGFVVVLSPIIIIHEIGHYAVAKWFGIEVEEFGLGYPPRAFKLFTWRGTDFTYNWIPFGGFVRPAGEDDPDVPGGLASASKRARLSVLAAGSIANIILAYFVLAFAFTLPQPINDIGVSEVVADSPAALAGLQAGDVIVTIEGESVRDNNAILTEIISESANEEVAVVVDRAGQAVPLTVIPTSANPEDPNSPVRIGIVLSPIDTGERTRTSVGDAFGESARTMWDITRLTVSAPVQLIRGQLTPEEARPIGIVGMSQIIGSQAQSATGNGDFFGLIFFAGVISLGLAITNLLPIPALDGGRILFVIIEAIRGRRIEPEREGLVHMIGFVLLIGLILLTVINDIINPIVGF